MPNQISISDELKEAGAKIYLYPELEHIPQSRFTIVNHGQMGARVAVGRRSGDKHLIEEFSAGEHPAFSVANDLIEVVTRLNKIRTITR